MIVAYMQFASSRWSHTHLALLLLLALALADLASPHMCAPLYAQSASHKSRACERASEHRNQSGTRMRSVHIARGEILCDLFSGSVIGCDCGLLVCLAPPQSKSARSFLLFVTVVDVFFLLCCSCLASTVFVCWPVICCACV